MPLPSADRLFLSALCVVALTAAAHLLAAPDPAPGGAALGGEVRDVDSELIRQRIRSGQLSDHEAEHYRVLDGGPEPERGPVRR